LDEFDPGHMTLVGNNLAWCVDEESVFQRVLDDNYRCATTRMLFAQWLAERGDPRAKGMWWMAEWGKQPEFAPNFSRPWTWYDERGGDDPSDELPAELVVEMSDHPGCRMADYLTRRDAEEALCRVLNKGHP
jgi:hypothetical protein